MRRPFARLAGLYERRLLARTPRPAQAPLFLLGVPRSGTTLLYQILVHCFAAAYLCNAADRFPRHPATVTRLLRARIRGHASDFSSNYGATRSLAGPSEARAVWRRWFSDGYADEGWLSAASLEAVRRTLGAVSALLEAPFVNKDPHHCVRVRALDVAFPDALFVYIHRDPLATAESILGLRRRRHARGGKSLDRWASVKPREHDRLAGAGHIVQICGQVHYCERNALDDLGAVARGRFLETSYEELCADPKGAIEAILRFLEARGLRLERRRPAPAPFPPSPGVELPEEDRRALRRELDRLGGRAS